MKLKKLFSYSNGRQIWRIIISELDSIVIEERDIINKQVFFSCIDKKNGKKIWYDKKFMQTDFWIGIETTHREILFLHLFEKPDMPKHKQIIAVGLEDALVKWTNTELTYDSISNGRLIGYIQNFEDRDYFLLDYKTGEILDSIGKDLLKIKEIRSELDNDISESFLFPSYLTEGEKFSHVNQNVLRVIGNTKYSGQIEYIEFENLFLFNYYEKNNETSLTNRLCVFDLLSQKVLMREILNSSSPAPVPDSFFIHGDILYFIKDKKELVAYSLKN